MKQTRTALSRGPLQVCFRFLHLRDVIFLILGSSRCSLQLYLRSSLSLGARRNLTWQRGWNRPGCFCSVEPGSSRPRRASAEGSQPPRRWCWGETTCKRIHTDFNWHKRHNKWLQLNITVRQRWHKVVTWWVARLWGTVQSGISIDINHIRLLVNRSNDFTGHLQKTSHCIIYKYKTCEIQNRLYLLSPGSAARALTKENALNLYKDDALADTSYTSKVFVHKLS